MSTNRPISLLLTVSTSWIYLILLNSPANVRELIVQIYSSNDVVLLYYTDSSLIVQTLSWCCCCRNGGRGISEYEKILTPQSDSKFCLIYSVKLMVFHAYEVTCKVHAIQYILTKLSLLIGTITILNTPNIDSFHSRLHKLYCEQSEQLLIQGHSVITVWEYFSKLAS